MALTFKQFVDSGFVPYPHKRHYEIILKVLTYVDADFTTVDYVSKMFKFREGDVLDAFWWAKGVTMGDMKVTHAGKDSSITLLGYTVEKFNQRVKEAYE